MQKVESSKPVHCVELVTGKNLTGTLVLSDERIGAHIFSYTDFFYIKGENPILLQTEANEIVSLHSNLTNPPGTTSRLIEPQRTTYRQDIISNLAVVGHDPWTEEDIVKRVTFHVKHCNDLMRHKAKVKAIGRLKYPTEDVLKIFEDSVKGMTIRAWYGATYGMEFDAPKALWPIFDIEFDEPQSIADYLKFVTDYVAFLSFCLGVRLKPSDIRVDRLSSAEMRAAVDLESYAGEHSVHYVWSEAEIDEQKLWVGSSPVISWDDVELSAFRA